MIKPGQDWRDEIIENIKLARIVLVLFSSDVNSSTELKKELAVASGADKIIIVVRIENVVPEAGYAYELSDRNWYDAFDNPEKQLDEVAQYIADVLKNPSDIERRFKISADELRRRRKLRLFGYYGLLRNNTMLAMVFFICFITQFFIYNSSMNATGSLISGGTSPLVAILDVVIATSIGAPLLLISAIQQELSISRLIVIICSMAISLILALLVRNFLSWVHNSVFLARP